MGQPWGPRSTPADWRRGPDEQALHDVFAERALFGHERRKLHPSNDKCRVGKCPNAAAITFVQTYINIHGEEAERRDPLCWSHYQRRRDRAGDTPGVSAKARTRRRVGELTPAQSAELTALFAA